MRKLVSVLGASFVLITVNAAAQDQPVAAEGTPLAEADKPEGEKLEGEKAVEQGESAAGGFKAETQSVAEEVGLRGVRQSQYGPAGCGLGSMLFEPDSGFTQIFAATTNGTSGTQTFGISSGTSNCEDTSGGSTSAQAFVETNRAALAKDIARGRGETISSLSELAGCQDARAVGRRLQKNFKTIFPNAKVSDRQVSETVVGLLKREEKLSCTRLGA